MIFILPLVVSFVVTKIPLKAAMAFYPLRKITRPALNAGLVILRRCKYPVSGSLF